MPPRITDKPATRVFLSPDQEAKAMKEGEDRANRRRKSNKRNSPNQGHAHQVKIDQRGACGELAVAVWLRLPDHFGAFDRGAPDVGEQIEVKARDWGELHMNINCEQFVHGRPYVFVWKDCPQYYAIVGWNWASALVPYLRKVPENRKRDYYKVPIKTLHDPLELRRLVQEGAIK